MTKAVNEAKELNDWATPTNHELKELVTSEEMSPEDRTKNILSMQEISRTKLPLVEPLGATYKELLTGKDRLPFDIYDSRNEKALRVILW